LQYHSLQTISQLQYAIKYNEEYLEQLVNQFEPKFRRRVEERRSSGYLNNNNYQGQTYLTNVENSPEFEDIQSSSSYRIEKSNRPTKPAVPSFQRKGNFNRRPARTYTTIGWTGKQPEFPRDDSNVSKGRTPEQIGPGDASIVGAENTGIVIASMQPKDKIE